VRGRQVKVPLIYHNWLIGAIPRQGKSAAVRVLACAAALDPLERVGHRFVSGIDDESIGRAAESLRLLRAEVGRRAERLRALPRELCPLLMLRDRLVGTHHMVRPCWGGPLLAAGSP
jgi:DNA segregation ATPase FtsK/SpoIIIE, S-DNA-T family